MTARPLAVLAVLAALLLAPTALAHHPGTNEASRAFPPGPGNVVHNVYRVDQAFTEWEAEYPDLVERFEIGSTVIGHPLHGIRVTDESVPFDAADVSTGHKLRVYLDGGHHGNEYLGVELVMYYLEDLLAKAAAGDEAALAFLADVEVHAVPIVNADGNLADSRKNANLVDPNRNYDYQFGGPGSGDHPWEMNYRGPEAFSEPETLANAQYALEISPDLWITMHSGVAEFYWPWGWTHDAPPDDAFFTSLEAPFEAATNGRVDAMQAADLYEAAGATDDWGYAVAGTPTFTFEVHEDQFIPVYGEPISDVIADQLAGLDFMVQNVQRLGAWVEIVPDAGTWYLQNSGWGVARNVTFVSGGDAWVIDEIPPGERVEAPAPPEAGARVEYPVLLIESSRVRTFTMPASDAIDAAGGLVERVVPGVPALALTSALAGVALALGAQRRAL